MFMPYGRMFYGFRFDWSYMLVLIGLIICMIASARVNSVYKKYSKTRSASGMTGAQASQAILNACGIYDVTIQHIKGQLTDHYDPRNKTLNLSDSSYNNISIAGIGVAAHECGHALQDAQGYLPLRIRSAIVPVVNFGNYLYFPLILIGLLFGFTGFLRLGIFCFTFIVLFQLVTLPVEFNASGRALKILGNTGILTQSEVPVAEKVLRAAALTYVASALSSILQLFRLVLLFGGRSNSDS